ncbi:MAG: hypothetical protein HC793_02475, partial [Aquincola sp.]|nr:hypothetical protein [Aquincola sp.]
MASISRRERNTALASEAGAPNKYKFFKSNPNRVATSDEMIDYWAEKAKKWPIRSLEDGLAPWRLIGNHTNSVVETGIARDGGSSLHILSTGVGGPTAAIAQSLAGLVSTDTYTFSFWFRPSTNGAGLNFRLTSTYRNPAIIDIKPIFFTPGLPNSTLLPSGAVSAALAERNPAGQREHHHRQR